ncbi:phytochrome-like protein cph1 [Geobacter sp. OR-1]|uniref:sensor histidine kinase n=1 Tax=Geobacter sp. OR-1 TaxID=1266765 RepID=UPI0005442849|nr:ATP-binding protein [Geobacter sp. OR-1]GAM11749.1 phytochrome-like protein cph1 [Geobacter sp. OR-1]
MDKDKSQFQAESELRRRALDRLAQQPLEARSPLTEHERLKLHHELQVHRLELEMQNAELRRARDDMEKALEMYTDLYDFAPVGYFTLGNNREILAANLTGANLLGAERSMLIGRRFDLFVADESQPKFHALFGRLFESRDKESCEVMLATGGNFPLFAQIEAVMFGSGQECRVAVIDITERKQLEMKIEAMNFDLSAKASDLAAANSELEAFNYTVSHDLRRPLAIIHGYCQVLQGLCSNQLDEQSKEFIREIYDGTLRMNRLITALLTFSRVTRDEMHRKTVDLSVMAKTVAAELEKGDPERRVTFRIAKKISADGDAGLLCIVLENLIGNAWKFTGNRKGTVIEVGMTECDGKPAYFVRDNGPGFDLTDAEKLFAPFHRLHGTEVDGHGIGLATVDRIIRRHGGRVWAESEPGKGAAFMFTLE